MLDFVHIVENDFCPYFGFIEEREENEQLITEEDYPEGYDDNNDDYLSEK